MVLKDAVSNQCWANPASIDVDIIELLMYWGEYAGKQIAFELLL